MPKICKAENCSYPVFGKGYCKFHQYLRKDKKKPSLKRTLIKKVSDKRRAKNVLYKLARAKFLHNHPLCEICTNEASTEIHHTYSGKDRDKYFLDETTWLAVSRNCHNKIHNNPKWARDNNYLK